MKLIALFLFIFSISSCQKAVKQQPAIPMTKNYLALGDSYTIGESVPRLEAFPFQLVEQLKKHSQIFTEPEIIATTGWTTDELITAIKDKNLSRNYDLVTLLIGVNNQYRGYSKENYRLEFKELLQTALSFADNHKERVFVISIPDWGVTPFAQKSNRDMARISGEINAYNAVNQEEALKAGVGYVDITQGSRKAGSDLSLLAGDGLHPSGKMYEEWVDMIVKLMNTRKSS